MSMLDFTTQHQYPTVFFGEYIIPDGSKPLDTYVRVPIEWLILDVNEQQNMALLVSRHILDWEGFAACPMLGHGYKTSWYDSYLRKWLNKDFYEGSFTNEERIKIVTTRNAASNGSGKQALDKIFLLSVDEIKKYFKTESSAVAVEPMIYNWGSGDKDDPIIIYHESAAWWTRTIGSTSDMVMCVSRNGKLFEIDSNSDEIGVRPAMWVNL